MLVLGAFIFWDLAIFLSQKDDLIEFKIILVFSGVWRRVIW
jgi:hypothetical protein